MSLGVKSLSRPFFNQEDGGVPASFTFARPLRGKYSMPCTSLKSSSNDRGTTSDQEQRPAYGRGSPLNRSALPSHPLLQQLIHSAGIQAGLTLRSLRSVISRRDWDSLLCYAHPAHIPHLIVIRWLSRRDARSDREALRILNLGIRYLQRISVLFDEPIVKSGLEEWMRDFRKCADCLPLP